MGGGLRKEAKVGPQTREYMVVQSSQRVVGTGTLQRLMEGQKGADNAADGAYGPAHSLNSS